jgi:hypothetical protein
MAYLSLFVPAIRVIGRARGAPSGTGELYHACAKVIPACP